MILLDKQIFCGILDITTDILQNNFFYDKESIEDFYEVFQNTMANEYVLFESHTDFDFKQRLRFDLMCRKQFTTYFVSYYLHDILVHDLHFSEMELDLFENILPKFVGVKYVKPQGDKRTNH
jgi:hypothetical protein